MLPRPDLLRDLGWGLPSNIAVVTGVKREGAVCKKVLFRLDALLVRVLLAVKLSNILMQARNMAAELYRTAISNICSASLSLGL